MIRTLPKDRVRETAARIWALVQDPSERCYPLVRDEADIERTLTWAREEDCARAFSCWKDGEPAGVCCLFVSEDETYAQIVALYAWNHVPQTLSELLRSVDKTFSGYTIDAGQAGENARLGNALRERGYRIVDDCLDLRRRLPAVAGADEPGEDLTLLEEAEDDGFKEYAPLHDAWFPGLYWNAERLRQYPGDWTVIAARRGGKTAGAILLVWGADLAEIYGLRAADGEMARALLAAAQSQASRPETDCRELLFMADAADETGVHAALEGGFRQAGRYVGWRKQPK